MLGEEEDAVPGRCLLKLTYWGKSYQGQCVGASSRTAVATVLWKHSPRRYQWPERAKRMGWLNVFWRMSQRGGVQWRMSSQGRRDFSGLPIAFHMATPQALRRESQEPWEAGRKLSKTHVPRTSQICWGFGLFPWRRWGTHCRVSVEGHGLIQRVSKLMGQLDRLRRKGKENVREDLEVPALTKEWMLVVFTERERMWSWCSAQGKIKGRCSVSASQSRNFILLASFSPLLSTHPPMHTHIHTLPPPTLAHPAHHCLVNLLKTPICLSDLNGSFKWLRISPGTTQRPPPPPLNLPNPAPLSSQPCFLSASVRPRRQQPHDLPASRPLFRPCSAPAVLAFPSSCHWKLKSESHSRDRDKRKQFPLYPCYFC